MPPSFKQQKKKFLKVKEKNSIKAGSDAYLISALWFNNWKKNVLNEEHLDIDEDSVKINQIDNRNLILNGKLKSTLTEKYDFVILSPPLWRLLLDWYSGGPEIIVKMVEHPEKHVPVPILRELTFYVYLQDAKNDDNMPTAPVIANTTTASTTSTKKEVKANKYELISEIKNRICDALNINPKHARLCDYWNLHFLGPISDNSYIYNTLLVDTQELLLQVRGENGIFGNRPRSIRRIANRTNSSMTIGRTPFGVLSATTKGHVGLSNLGNTCYFNSAVQALSHTPLFATYFMNANWRENVNHVNRLSTNGLLANSLAQLVNDIWSKNICLLSPKKLLDTVVQFAPRFGDHKQHDSQELMMFLLDGLHEDLNKAENDVYIEGVDGDSTCEEMTAEASWRRHKQTNDSIIVDLFHGQLCSELKCPACNANNLVFDPYLCVTLPLPTERMHSERYYFIPFDQKKMRQFVKIHVISTNEVENITKDATDRFQLENCVVIPLSVLIDDLEVRILSHMHRTNYFVFELPPKSPTENEGHALYTLATVFVKTTKKKTLDIIDGPFLVQSPMSKRVLQKAAECRVAHYWEDTAFPEDERSKAREKFISTEIPTELRDKFQNDQQKLFVEVVNGYENDYENKGENKGENRDGLFEPCEYLPQISCESLKIVLNPLQAVSSQKFHWSAVLPIDRSGNSAKPVENIEMSLKRCFECFSYSDKLDETNSWFCPNCRKLVEATARLSIWSVPDNLILHIKRFIMKDNSFKKVVAKIEFPDIIDMAPFVRGPQKQEKTLEYKLHAYVNHHGTMCGGHYTATSYSEVDQKWYTYNDDAVYQEEDVGSKSETAYVLFYHRLNEDVSS